MKQNVTWYINLIKWPLSAMMLYLILKSLILNSLLRSNASVADFNTILILVTILLSAFIGGYVGYRAAKNNADQKQAAVAGMIMGGFIGLVSLLILFLMRFLPISEGTVDPSNLGRTILFLFSYMFFYVILYGVFSIIGFLIGKKK